jgi:hypothetical protein
MAGANLRVGLFYNIDSHHNLSTTDDPDCDFLVFTQSTSSRLCFVCNMNFLSWYELAVQTSNREGQVVAGSTHSANRVGMD